MSFPAEGSLRGDIFLEGRRWWWATWSVQLVNRAEDVAITCKRILYRAWIIEHVSCTNSPVDHASASDSSWDRSIVRKIERFRAQSSQISLSEQKLLVRRCRSKVDRARNLDLIFEGLVELRVTNRVEREGLLGCHSGIVCRAYQSWRIDRRCITHSRGLVAQEVAEATVAVRRGCTRRRSGAGCTRGTRRTSCSCTSCTGRARGTGCAGAGRTSCSGSSGTGGQVDVRCRKSKD